MLTSRSGGMSAAVSDTGHFIRSISAFGGAQVVSWLATASLIVLLPRFLSDESVGKLVLASTLSTLIGLFAELGSTTYLAREIARDPRQANRLIGEVLALRIVLSLAGLGTTIALANLGGYDDVTRTILYFFCIGQVLAPLTTVVNGSLQGFHQLKSMAGYSVVMSLGHLGLVAGAIALGGGLLEVVVAEILTGIIALTFSVRRMLHFARLSLRFEWAAWSRILLGGLPFFTWSIATLIYSKVDLLQLSLMTNDAVVGWYAVAYRVIGIPTFVPSIVMTVSFPILASTASNGEVFCPLARRSIRTVILACLPMGLGIMVLADKMIAVLGFSDGFQNATVLIVVLAPHIVLVGVNMQIGTVLNVSGGHWKWTVVGIAAAGLNPILNFAAIPYTHDAYGNGAIGAAVVTILTELFLFVVALRLLPRGFLDRATVLHATKCLAAGLVMVAAIWPARDLPIAAPIALGALAYGTCCFAVGAVSLDDLRQLAAARRRPPVASPA